ncbi:hypothetical protein BVRB_026460, partial [Beta vulgaris subsp. vulgaris]
MISSGLSKVGNILSSPIRAFRQVSTLLSPTKQESSNVDIPEETALQPQRKRRRSGEQTPDKKIRKISKMQPSLKRPRRDGDIDENENPQKKKQKTETIFNEKDGGKLNELEQRKTERARWCREQLHKQFENIADIVTARSGSVEKTHFQQPNTMMMTPIPSKNENKSETLRRSIRKSAARANRRISMQFEDVKARVAIRKLHEQIKIEEAIRDREAEILQKEKEDESYREQRTHWQSVFGPQIAGRLCGKSPIQVIK